MANLKLDNWWVPFAIVLLTALTTTAVAWGSMGTRVTHLEVTQTEQKLQTSQIGNKVQEIHVEQQVQRTILERIEKKLEGNQSNGNE